MISQASVIDKQFSKKLVHTDLQTGTVAPPLQAGKLNSQMNFL